MEPGHGGPVSTSRLLERFRANTETGALGDPTRASAGAGAAILDRLAGVYAEHTERERGEQARN